MVAPPTGDLSRLPGIAQYLSQLPEGLASYPACQMRTDFARDSMHEYPALLTMREVPPELRNTLEESVQGEWQPAVHAMVHQRLLRDLLFRGDDTAYMQHAFEGCARLFATPIYRALFFIMSPNLLILGAHNRWSMFCRGIEFTTLGGGKQTHRAGLQFPPHLFDTFSSKLIASTLTAALAAAGARGVEYAVTDVTETRSQLHVRWTAIEGRLHRL